jgi:hypothetical protein
MATIIPVERIATGAMDAVPMKLKAVALLVGLCLAGQASGQVVIVQRPADGTIYGASGWRYFPPRVSLAIISPPPRITINNNFFGGQGPILGPGYSEDTRGVDLDLVPPKRAKAATESESTPNLPEPESAKPLPGVEVSKSRPPVRPGDPGEQTQTLPKKLPPEAGKPPKVAPELADPGSNPIEWGLTALQAGEYGVAAQRFRQAVDAAPKKAGGHFLLAQAEFAMGNYRAAVAAIHAGMKIDKQWPGLPIRLRLDIYQGREPEFTDQMQRLTAAVAANPNHPILLFLFAHQLWFDGRRVDALALFQRARPLTGDPAFIDAFLAAGGPGQIAAR